MSDQVGETTLQIMSEAKRYNRHMYQLVRPFLKGRIVEIGSGTGTFTAMMIRDGFKVTALDINTQYLNRIKKVLGVSTINLDLQTKVLPQQLKNSFDTAVALNVIEHILRPEDAVANISTMLKPNGRLIVLVPANKWAYGSLDEKLGHIKRYNRAELLTLLQNSGLKVTMIKDFNFLGVFGWWWNSRVTKRHLLPMWQVRLFDLAISPWLWLEHIINFPLGLSLVAVAEK